MYKYPLYLTNLPLVGQGKTRDTYRTFKSLKYLLMVATERLSTHNVVHHSLVPFKDEVLTALTVFWFTQVLDKLPNHLVAFGQKIYEYLPSGFDFPKNIHLRAIIVRRLDIIAVEFIWRMYLAGSLWRDYYSKGIPDPYGLNFQKDLPLMHLFPDPVFTPTDKSSTDDPRAADEIRSIYLEACKLSLDAFWRTRVHLNLRDIENVDGKSEIGIIIDPSDEEREKYPKGMMLADEISTPDSNRFAVLSKIREGSEPEWYDKQIVRDAAEKIWAGGERVPLAFESDVIKKLSERYLMLFELVTGQSLSDFQKMYMS